MEPGTQVAHYKLGARLGAGGMGEVFRATDTRLGRDVAIKFLKPDSVHDPERLKRFESEARTVGALNHPHIVAVFDVGSHGGAPFLVTELLEGATLRELLEAGPVPFRKALEYAVQIAHGLAAAHDKGIVHRDLKPANLFVTRDGHLKILDFGLAKVTETRGFEATLEQTAEGAVLGTAGYMAPEQVRGRPADARSDIFSLGAVLFEMLTGRRAFDGATAVERGYAILNAEPAELGPSIPAAVERLTRRCLEKSPEHRFQSARDLGFALDAVSGSSGSSEPLPLRPARAGRNVLSLLALAGVAAISWSVGRLHGAAAPRVEQPVARAPLPLKLTRLTHEYGAEWWPALSPDSTWLVYVRGLPGKSDLFRQRVGGENPINLTPDSPGEDSQPAISPDGERIAFRSDREGGGIFLMGSTGESIRRVTDFGYRPAWSPDGKQLVVSAADNFWPSECWGAGKPTLVNVDTGAKRPLETTWNASELAWSPDGKWIAYGCCDPSSFALGVNGLCVVAANGGPEVRLFEQQAGHTGTPAWAPDSRQVYFGTDTSGATNVWRVAIDGTSGHASGAPEPVTNGVARVTIHPGLARDGGLMVFSSTLSIENLYRVRFDAAHGRLEGPPEALTRGSNGFMECDVSPDGEWVTFFSWPESSGAQSQPDILLMRADGSGRRRLTDDRHLDRLPRFTSDGRQILFPSKRGGRSDIWSISPDGSGLANLTAGLAAESRAALPCPVDSRVAVVEVPDDATSIYDGAKPLGQQVPTRLAPLGRAGLHFLPSRWSADGERLIGHLRDGAESPRGVASYTLADRTYRDLSTGQAEHPVPLKDGKRVVVISGGRLELLDSTTGQLSLLLQGEPGTWVHSRFSVSRDERWIYYSLITEDGDVWLAELR